MRGDFVKNKIFIVIASIVIILLISCLYLFTNIGSYKLTNVQEKELKKQLTENYYSFSEEDYPEMKKLDSVVTSEFKIFEYKKKKDIIEAYGYVFSELTVKFKEKSYVDSGSWGIFTADFKVSGNSVKVLDLQDISEPLVYDSFSFRSKLKSKIFNKEKYNSKIREDIENKLKAPFDDKWTLSIDNGKYELYDIDESGNTAYKEKGSL